MIIQMKKIALAGIAMSLGLLTACGDADSTESSNVNMEKVDHSEKIHSSMSHSSSGEIPEKLKVAENPTFPLGSQAIIKTDHMQGMSGAEATIVGAYDTTVYKVSYTPTNGGEKVENHKWVIHEEIKNASNEPFVPGTKVTLNTDHMEGMDGANAVIDAVEQATVYMIDFTSTSGEKIENHKWVTESELAAE